MRRLEAAIEVDPEVDLLAKLHTISRELDAPVLKKYKPNPKKLNFYERLVFGAKKAEIVHPLSEAGTSLLASYTTTALLDGPSLVDMLKGMRSTSEKLWENPVRGVVLKCNQELAAKMKDSTKVERGSDRLDEGGWLCILRETSVLFPLMCIGFDDGLYNAHTLPKFAYQG